MPPISPNEVANGLKEHFQAMMLLVEPELNQWLRENYHFLNGRSNPTLLFAPSSKPQLKWGRGEAEYVAAAYQNAGWVTNVVVDRDGIFVQFSGVRPTSSHSQYGDH
jgi:hypothetical protein